MEEYVLAIGYLNDEITKLHDRYRETSVKEYLELADSLDKVKRLIYECGKVK